MGISGLLPLLKSIHKPGSIKKFSGQTVGVDAYGWLHRGTVACAMELALDKPTRRFVDFAMHRVRMLLHFGVTPYLVFDGDYLPSKAATEASRAKARDESRLLGLELYKRGKTSMAYQQLQKAVDVTPEMARQLMEELKRTGVQYLVAPYEADAQLTYLERKGVISAIISEDSDLLVFGAKCLLTKLDQYGECVEINQDDFCACTDISLSGWSNAEFRRMAILSGCDYLASIPKMGLKTAYRLVRKHKNIESILRAIQFDGQFRVPTGYLEAFQQAELTFLHQRVFCPIEKMLVMHSAPDVEIPDAKLSFIGAHVEAETAKGVACGDLHPMTKEPLVCNIVDKGTPRTPWSGVRRAPLRTASTGALQDLKGNKPISTFFGPKRIPLAELDPNSFTPSPSQQRLLRQHSGSSWSADANTTRPGLLRSSTSNLAVDAATPTRAASTATANASQAQPLHARLPSKRPRLCSDEAEQELVPGAPKIEFGRSPFFASSAPVAGSGEQKASKKKQKKDDINIFSDDSVDDVMAGLPDLDGLPHPKKPVADIKIFEDGASTLTEHAKKNVLSEPERVSLREYPMNKSRRSSSQEGNVPIGNVPIAVEGKHIINGGTQIRTLKDDFSYKPVSKAGSANVKMSTETFSRSRIPLAVKTTSRPNQTTQNHSSKAANAVDESTKVRIRAETPLQRLGQGALRRAQSYATKKSASTHLVSVHSVQVTTVSASSLDTLPKQDVSGSITETSAKSSSPKAMVRGSEDSILPGSSDDETGQASSGSEATERATRSIDLQSFAFVAK